MQITVKAEHEGKDISCTIDVNDETTVRDIKVQLQEAYNLRRMTDASRTPLASLPDLESSDLRIIHNDEELTDDKKLNDLRLSEGQVFNCDVVDDSREFLGTVTIQDLDGNTYKVNVYEGYTVADIKKAIHQQRGSTESPFKLMLNGKFLESDTKLTKEQLQSVVRFTLIHTLGHDGVRPSEDSDDKQEPKCTVYIQTLTGRVITISFDPSKTVGDVKQAIFEKEGIPVDQQILIHAGKTLSDDQLASEIPNKAAVHLVLKLGQSRKTDYGREAASEESAKGAYGWGQPSETGYGSEMSGRGRWAEDSYESEETYRRPLESSMSGVPRLELSARGCLPARRPTADEVCHAMNDNLPNDTDKFYYRAQKREPGKPQMIQVMDCTDPVNQHVKAQFELHDDGTVRAKGKHCKSPEVIAGMVGFINHQTGRKPAIRISGTRLNEKTVGRVVKELLRNGQLFDLDPKTGMSLDTVFNQLDDKERQQLNDLCREKQAEEPAIANRILDALEGPASAAKPPSIPPPSSPPSLGGL